MVTARCEMLFGQKRRGDDMLKFSVRDVDTVGKNIAAIIEYTAKSVKEG